MRGRIADASRVPATYARIRLPPPRPPQGCKTDSARPRPGGAARQRGCKTDSAWSRTGGALSHGAQDRFSATGEDRSHHTQAAVRVRFCRLHPDVRTRLPATPAHFIGCFFCTVCSKAQPRPCMAFSGLRWHRLALRFPAQ